MARKMKRATDLKPPQAFPEIQRTVVWEDLLDKPDIVIHDFEMRPGANGDFMVVLAEDEQGQFTTTTGAQAVTELIKKAKEENELPFVATVKEEKSRSSRYNYYVLV